MSKIPVPQLRKGRSLLPVSETHMHRNQLFFFSYFLFITYKNLRFLADIQRKIGRDEIRLAMKQVGLNPDMRKRVGTYSLGMRQRLGLAQAIMEDPPILLLDEPMNGLDEAGIQFVRELLQRLRNHGKLILMASHMKEDLDLLCDEIYRVHEGSLFLQC